MHDKKEGVIAKTLTLSILIATFIMLTVFIEPIGIATEITFIPESINFVLRREIRLRGNFEATIQIPIPSNATYQKVYVEQLGGTPHITVQEFTTLWKWNVKDSDYIVLEYRGTSYGAIWNQHSTAGIEDIPKEYMDKYMSKKYLYTGGEKKYVVTPNSTEIIYVSQNITSKYKSVVEKLRAIHEYITQNIRYERSRGEIKSALEVLKEGYGDCDEISFLYVSMARAVGIPAWLVYGIIYDDREWSYHAWVRSYVPGLGKIDCDATADLGRKRLVGFMTKSPYCLEIWEDDGKSEDLTHMYKFITYTGALEISEINITTHISRSEKNLYISYFIMIDRKYLLLFFGIIFIFFYFSLISHRNKFYDF